MYAGGATAVACAVLAAAALSVSVLWLALMAAAAVYLGYQGHRQRIEDERRNAQRMSELHLATVEALALAFDA